MTVLVGLISAFPYMMFVAGPRIASGAALAWRPWIIRFGLFYIATIARNGGYTWSISQHRPGRRSLGCGATPTRTPSRKP